MTGSEDNHHLLWKCWHIWFLFWLGFFEEHAYDIITLYMYASEHELNSVNNHLLYSTKFRERRLSMTIDNHILAIPCIKTISVSTCHNMSIYYNHETVALCNMIFSQETSNNNLCHAHKWKNGQSWNNSVAINEAGWGGGWLSYKGLTLGATGTSLLVTFNGERNKEYNLLIGTREKK